MKVRDDHWNVFILHDVGWVSAVTDKIKSYNKGYKYCVSALQDCIEATASLVFAGLPDESEILELPRHWTILF